MPRAKRSGARPDIWPWSAAPRKAQLLYGAIGNQTYWIGLTNSTAYGGTDHGSETSLPTTTPYAAGNKGYGFVWCDGETTTYMAFPSGQPNDSSSGTTPANYVEATSGSGAWDDRSDTNTANCYVIEFNLGLTSPPDSGSLSVVEVHGSATLSSISGGISLLNTPGSATVSNYTSVLTAYCDPEDMAAGHFTAFPFGGDTTAADHNFAVEVQGTVQIPATGTYTFNVNSSDGFQLTIGGATFSGNSSGTTYSGSTMSYSGTRTTADSLGVTSLNAGSYPITLYYFNGASDAPRLELSAASGSYSTFNSSNFHLLGDTTNGGLSVSSTVQGSTAHAAPPCRRTCSRRWPRPSRRSPQPRSTRGSRSARPTWHR